MRTKFLLLLSLLVASNAFAQAGLSPGVSANSFTASTATNTAGTPYALPQGFSPTISWTITTVGGPSAISVSLQGSQDNIAWFTLDTSTATAGEIRYLNPIALKFVRAFITSRTGGTNISVSLLVNRGFNNVVSGGTFTTGISVPVSCAVGLFGYTFNGDDNTKVCSDAADSLKVITGGDTIVKFAKPTGASATSHFFDLTATIPTLSSQFRGVNISLTEPENVSPTIRMVHITNTAAAVSGNGTFVGVDTAVASETTGLLIGGAFAATSANGSTGGKHYGIGSSADDGEWNIGTSAHAYDTGTFNVGFWGNAEPTATNTIGGLFQLQDIHAVETPPPSVSAAIVADNVAAALPIALWLDNGVEVGRIADGGAQSSTVSYSAPTYTAPAGNLTVQSNSGSNVIINATGAASLSLRTNSTERLLINSSGHVSTPNCLAVGTTCSTTGRIQATEGILSSSFFGFPGSTGFLFRNGGGTGGGLINSFTSGDSIGTQANVSGPVTVATCGTGTVTTGSRNEVGQITATGATACTVNFSISWTNAPFCTITLNNAPTTTPYVSARAVGSITVSGLTAGDVFTYMCRGQLGS